MAETYSKPKTMISAIHDYIPLLSDYLSRQNKLIDFSQIKHMARTDGDPITPSFKQKMDQQIRKDFFVEEQLKQKPFNKLIRNKLECHQFLKNNHIECAEILHGEYQLAYLLRLIQNLQHFTIKPIHASNGWGVVPAIKLEDHRIKNLLNHQESTISQLLTDLNQLMQRYMFPNKWYLEELLLPADGEFRALTDYKFYAFKGFIALILVAEGRGPDRRYRWFDKEWNPVDVGKYQERIDNSIKPPQSAAQLIEKAEQVSMRLPISFCRIDMYDSHKGILVGELTPEPGSYQNFSAPVDEYLGICWEIADILSINTNKDDS